MKTLKRIIRFFDELGDYLRPMGIPLHSAHASFFLVLSIFPSLLLLLGLLRYTSFGSDDLLMLAERILPESLIPVATMLIDASYRHSSGAVVSVSVLATLWSGSCGMYGLMGGLLSVYGDEIPKNYLRTRGMSVLYNFVFLLAIAFILVLQVVANAVVDFLRMTTIPSLMHLLNRIDLPLLLLFVLQTLLFAVTYSMLPGHHTKLKLCIPGALLSSIGWAVFSRLFSVYVSYFSMYTNIYGSIYALALGMLWLYCCISILLYGGALTRWLKERTPDFFRKD